MKTEEFFYLAELLSGTELKAKDAIDTQSLGSILADDDRTIDCSQFNELLLLVHKNREYFFGAECTVGKIPDGVQRFRKNAMLRYGNFVFGFRTLSREDPGVVFERLRFVLYADDQLPQRLSREDNDLVDRGHDRLKEILSKRIWPSLPGARSFHELQNVTSTDREKLCRIIATAERAIYDRRAKTLRESHPLAVQVNLGTGVANGVLVVRRVEKCAALLRCVLLNDMEFELEMEDAMWYLREKISGCIYRVVTNDRKLNNCFWNFYLR